MKRACAWGLLVAVLFAAASPGAHVSATELAVRGCDVSKLAKGEALGARFFTAAGEPAEALDLLARGGVNLVRLKVWIDSPDGYHGTEQLVAMARRARARGLGLLVNFHYSSTWADPGQQAAPAAWAGLDAAELAGAVYRHTHDTLAALVAAGIEPAYVQVGNEINDGMLWPTGRITGEGDGFARLAPLLRAGVRAVREAAPSARVVLHIAKGGDAETVRWWFDGVRAQGVEWDVTAVSYYPYWHGTLADLGGALRLAAERYERPVLVVETAYPFTLRSQDAARNMVGRAAQLTEGYPASAAGQAAMLRAIAEVIARVPDGRGLGLVYWEGTWLATPGNDWNPAQPGSGNAWENQALFDFDGRALPALEALGGQPE